jgi:sortase A
MSASRIVLSILFVTSIGASFLPLTRHLGPEFVNAAAWYPLKEIAQYTVAPSHVSIPSIGLDSPIEALGVNAKGEMDVPDGKTSAVGWYQDGTVPGNVGSAVFDAHVFAAFSKLSAIKPGSDIYVTEGTKTLHFVVAEARTYPLSALTPRVLFAQHDARRLNLITCAGTYVPALGTYDQRLVVYATLAA